MPVLSRAEYERFIYVELPQHTAVRQSTLHLYMNSPHTAFVRGTLFLANAIELRVFEYLDLAAGEILEYSYSVYHGEEKIRWYDAQPHPENPALASTFPHHYHAPPDIKHHRLPAPGISFHAPNLPQLIADCLAITL
jgi:hypothetical protein